MPDGAGATSDKHRSADLLARARVYVGIALLVLGMSLSIPSARTEDWLTVLSYLSITAAGLCLIFTGSVRRQAIRAQRNHEAIHSELSRLAEQVMTIGRLDGIVEGHGRRLNEHDRKFEKVEGQLGDVVEFLKERYDYGNGFVDGASAKLPPAMGTVHRLPTNRSKP